ncbi:Cytochrome-b5 reductase [Aphelenchoides fujianensis]|nr:Cytochrome-b5 reductase [Aphelenchoides fujianensis]
MSNGSGIVAFTDLQTKVDLKLAKKVIISPNTRLFRFALPSNTHVPGLKAGEHVQVSAIVDGKEVTRKYTPVSDDELTGYVDLVIKVYFANQHPNYPKGGVMSQHLERLDIGDTVTFAGPVTRIIYDGHGTFRIKQLGTTNFTEKHFRRLAIAVGGTGITPMLQIIHRILKNPDDRTEIWMLFANNTPNDVLLKDKLDHLAEKHPQQFHVWYTASLPDETWKYSVGHVTQEMIQRYLPAPEDSAAVICGPPAFKTKAPSVDDMTIEKMNGTLATFTSADVVVRLRLIEKWSISPNTRIFRFALPSAEHMSGLGPGDHVKISAEINGKTVSRKYTHTSDDDQRGFIDFLVKIYGPNEHPEYPEGGLLTPWLDSLQINEEANFTGPVGRISYRGDGLFRIREKRTHVERERRFRRLGMLAGGSGITPPFQVLNAILKNPNDPTEVWLLFANNKPEDVLLKAELDALAAKHPTRFHVWYTVTRPDADWTYSTGYITKEMISVYLPPADEHTGVVLCGPKAMRNEACIPNLHALGFTDDQLVIF